MIDATIGMFDIMMERITKNMIETHPPSIYFHPRLVGIRMLDFNKAEDVFSQMEQELEKFKQKLERQIT
jgi:predicted acylesterase/phospholipase RssA